MRTNRKRFKVFGLRAKTFASVLIFLELILIISTVGFGFKSRIKIAEAEGAYNNLPREEIQTIIKDPTSEQQQIIEEIKTVFGKDSDNAFKILSCENHYLRPNAINYNTDGSFDLGIFQINSVHKVNPVYLYDFKTNITVAYHIFKDSGWGAWVCSRRVGL